MSHLTLQLIAGEFAICRLPATEPVPAWADSGVFSAVTRTSDELSIICPANQVPTHINIRSESGWRLVKFVGPFDFGAVGILASVTQPLALAGISLLALGTFDTDYVLLKTGRLTEAIRILKAVGHTVRTG